MRIFVDADACPKLIKDIIVKTSLRTTTTTIFVANQYLSLPYNQLIKCIVVNQGIDEADKYIANNILQDDLVITADIPLADIIVTKGGIALNPRGTLYTLKNIKHKLATRNLLSELRDNQIISGGPSTFTKLDCQNFANQLDKLLNRKK